MSSWLCYLLQSVDSNRTYIGATDNLYRRLCDHNGLHGPSKGAKATKGEMWYPVLCVTGFPNKIACLSFESGVRRIRRRKCPHRYKCHKGDKPVTKRVIDVYNLLEVGSPLNKWHPPGLTINWLETSFRSANLVTPKLVKEESNFHQLACLT